MIIIIILIVILLFLIFSKQEKFQTDKFVPDFISIYEKKLGRFKNSDTKKRILLLGSISQKKLDFFTNYFNNSIIYVYNEDNIVYKNIDESIIKNEDYPFMIEEVDKLKRSNKTFDIILTQGQISIDNFMFIAKNYINLLEKDGIIIFENIQTLDNIGKIIDSIPLDIKNKFEIHDLRRVNGKYDNICIIMDKHI
jgi:hypothetical protein